MAEKILTCTKRWTDFPFAHRQPNHKGHCAHIHGHNWSFEFEFMAYEKDACGFVVDFGGLKQMKEWLDATFDHRLVLNKDDKLINDPALSKLFAVTGNNLTMVKDCSCEGLAEYLFSDGQKMIHDITSGRVAVRRVTVFEDTKNSATVEATLK